MLCIINTKAGIERNIAKTEVLSLCIYNIYNKKLYHST